MVTGPDRPYVALIRGINVGGHARVTMIDLRAVFAAAGAREVRTHIQSGNVLFRSRETDAVRLARKLERQFEASIGFRAAIFVLTPAEVAAAAAANPLDPRRLAEEQVTHLMFLSDEPAAERFSALAEKAREQYRMAVRGRVLYFAYSRTLVGNRKMLDMERLLGVTGTARQWNVVDKLLELCEAGGEAKAAARKQAKLAPRAKAPVKRAKTKTAKRGRR
jgi:uncharacterized protein (DUF1697 family)